MDLKENCVAVALVFLYIERFLKEKTANEFWIFARGQYRRSELTELLNFLDFSKEIQRTAFSPENLENDSMA